MALPLLKFSNSPPYQLYSSNPTTSIINFILGPEGEATLFKSQEFRAFMSPNFGSLNVSCFSHPDSMLSV